MQLSADTDACARTKSTLTQSNVTTQFVNGEMDGRIANVTNLKILSEGDELKQHVVTPDCILSGSSVLLNEVSKGEWSAENTVVCKNGSDSLSQVQKIKVNSANNSSPIDSCRHHLFDLQGNNARLTPPPNSARKATRCLNDQFDSLTLDNNDTTNTQTSKYEEKNDPTNDLVDSEISCATTAEITCSTTCGAAQESADHDQSNGTNESLELHQEEDDDFFDRKSCIVMAVRDPSAVVTHAGDFKSDMKNTKIPQALRLNLPQAMLNRITLYGLIHDINREATSMESEDYIGQCGGSDVAGSSNTLKPKEEEFLIDEEQWLLSVISKRRTKEELVQVGALKTSLEQALGEEETDEVDVSPSQKKAMASVKCKEEVPNQIKTKFEASRTRLWKPSRSWWEARSGKNPWIEPKSHNKRWRYLWPMIHYHKFLTKSVKKLRRNGVDCRTSCSPVVVFLRDEVCGISEHLGEASKFSAEQWTLALDKFYGWSSKSNLQAAKMLGNIVARQATCALPNADSEGDDKSPLIKSQIDCSLLTSVVTGRQAGPKKKQNRSVSSGSLRKSEENRSQADTMSQSSCANSDSQNTDYSIGQYYACLEDQNMYQGPTIMGYPPQYPHPSLGYAGQMSLQQDLPSQMHQQRKKNNQSGRNKRGFGKKGKHIPGTVIPNPDFRNIQNPDFESMQQYPYYGVPCGIPLQHHLAAPHPVIHPHYDQWAHQGYSLDVASFQNPPVPSSPYQEQRPPTFPVSFGSPNYPPHMGGATDTPQSHRGSGAPLHWSHLDQATLEMTGISSPGHDATPVRSRSSYNHVKQNSTPRQLLFNIPNHKSPDKMSPASKFLSSHVESADPFFGAQQHHARYHFPYLPPSTSGLPPRLHIQSIAKDGSRDSSVLTPKSNKKKFSNRRKNRQCPSNS